jgi:hypothetical protein
MMESNKELMMLIELGASHIHASYIQKCDE